jgi:glycosyltransferase involved in cell wall biosynthesis
MSTEASQELEFRADREPALRASRAGRRLRVLHVGKYYPPVPGGMERVLQLLCESERRLVDSRVLVVNTGAHTSREVRGGVPVTRAATLARVGSVGLSPALAIELARTPADVTVLHEPNPVALVADMITRRRGALVVYFHSEVVRAEWKYQLMYRPFLRRVLDRAARILVASPAMRDSATQLDGYRHKCAVVPYGIDLASLAATPDIEAAAQGWRRDMGPLPLLLFVGRLVPYKGVDVLIRAMRGLEACLAIVGDGPSRGALERLAVEAGVAGRVRFLGALPDEPVLALYHACDVFVLPSVTRAEAFGMVQLEAMACGKPVVSTNLASGVPWVNQHGDSGLVVPPGDVEGLHASLQLLIGDRDLRASLGNGARRRVEREFTAERMARRTLEIYEEIAAP